MATTTPETKPPETPNEAPAEKTENQIDLDKVVQSAKDQVRTEYSKKFKALESELESLRKEKMTADEIKALERKQFEERLTQKERDLNDKEISIRVRDLLAQESLPGSLAEYLKGDTVDNTEKRVKAFKKEFQKALEVAVEDRMKAVGRDPNKGREGSSGTSEFAGMTPAEIEKKAKADPEWMRKHGDEIIAAMASGKLKK